MNIVRKKHRRRLALLKERLLVRPRGRVVVQGQLQFGAVRLLRRRHREPSKRAVPHVGLLDEAQHLRIKAEGFVLVVDVNAGQLDSQVETPRLAMCHIGRPRQQSGRRQCPDFA
jgi:hypothetical protein